MDWLKMYPAYTYYTKRFRQSSQGGVDDMFGYVLAAMHHGLRHKSATEIMISDPKSIHAEGWHFIDGMTPDGRSLRRANESRHYRINFHPDGHTAPILHYCQNNEPGHGLEFGSHIRFSKYEWNRAPLGLPTCDPLPEYRCAAPQATPANAGTGVHGIRAMCRNDGGECHRNVALQVSATGRCPWRPAPGSMDPFP